MIQWTCNAVISDRLVQCLWYDYITLVVWGSISTARLITGSTSWSHHADTTRTALATHPRACQVHSRCPGRCLSTRQMTAASCPTALGALCGQLTFRLACCREHSAVTTTELLQPLDLACGTLFLSSSAIRTSPTYCSDNSWQNIFLGAWTCTLWLLISGALLTYSLST